jgi:hypothetical protein
MEEVPKKILNARTFPARHPEIPGNKYLKKFMISLTWHQVKKSIILRRFYLSTATATGIFNCLKNFGGL